MYMYHGGKLSSIDLPPPFYPHPHTPSSHATPAAAPLDTKSRFSLRCVSNGNTCTRDSQERMGASSPDPPVQSEVRIRKGKLLYAGK